VSGGVRLAKSIATGLLQRPGGVEARGRGWGAMEGGGVGMDIYFRCVAERSNGRTRCNARISGGKHVPDEWGQSIA